MLARGTQRQRVVYVITCMGLCLDREFGGGECVPVCLCVSLRRASEEEDLVVSECISGWLASR